MYFFSNSKKNNTQWLVELRWDELVKGGFQFIPAIRTWLVRKHGQVNFYLAQLLSSHGCSREDLRWLDHEDSARHAAKLLILLATQDSTFQDCIPQDIRLGTQ